jgi:hypothetical protein
MEGGGDAGLRLLGGIAIWVNGHKIPAPKTKTAPKGKTRDVFRWVGEDERRALYDRVLRS